MPAPQLLGIIPVAAQRAATERSERQECAEHEHVAVGEIDQLDDPIDHRVAQRHQREQRAVGQPDQAYCRERLPEAGRVGGGRAR